MKSEYQLLISQQIGLVLNITINLIIKIFSLLVLQRNTGEDCTPDGMDSAVNIDAGGEPNHLAVSFKPQVDLVQ